MQVVNRQIVLAGRPAGMPKESDFRLVESPVPRPASGEVLVRAQYLSVDPYMRARLGAQATYARPVEVGEVMIGAVAGQVVFGGTRGNDRSVSTFDQRHVIHGSVIYDLPVGKGRRLLNNTWKPLDFVLGGWTMSSLIRYSSGFPYTAYLSDTNQLGDYTHAARPDVNVNEPLLNPLYDRACPTGTGCQPYLNPSAFMRPAL
jgi:NADPH-dependent curcumin reductase CurA